MLPLPLPVTPDSDMEKMARCVMNKWQGFYRNSQESEEAPGLILSYLLAGSSLVKNTRFGWTKYSLFDVLTHNLSGLTHLLSSRPCWNEFSAHFLREWTNGHDLCLKLRHSRGYAPKAGPYYFQARF